MRRILPGIFLMFCVLHGTAYPAELLKVAKIETKDIVQLYFSFDKPPSFSSNRIDRRIDLEFYGVTGVPSAPLVAPDDDIVKILPRPGEDSYIVSLFFRYRPQHYKLTKSGDGKLVFEVLLGNAFSKSYQDLAEKLKGLTVLERIAIDTDNPHLNSPYKKDWPTFFSQYESPVKIAVPVKFTLPPFPIIGLLPPKGKGNLRIISAKMSSLAKQNLWDPLAGELLDAIRTTTDLETKKLLALTYGEVLSRAGKFEDAFRQLYLLRDQYVDELLSTYARFLLIHLRAVYQDPFLAEDDLRLLEPVISNTLPLAPYFRLLEIETALATTNYERLNHLLQQDDIALPTQVAEIIKIRQADYWYAIGQQIKAKAASRLIADSPVLPTLPYSLSATCNIAYEQHKYVEAAACYETLSHLVTDKPLLGLIDYRKEMARLKFTDKTALIDAFTALEQDFPDTEAGFRAALKRNDLLFLQDRAWGSQAIKNYGAVAAVATSRPIREEALFKQALVHAILGETTESIPLLQHFLREFLIGDVRKSAQALLIELLPGEIKRLVDNKQYIQPLVLAKQNKDLFEKKWIDPTFLVDIAEAYNRIGIFDEAQKLYLYLIGIMPKGQKEQLFPPMIRATYANGNYPLVEDYAAQYTYTYPEGSFATEILLVRLQALVADERLGDVLKLLPNPLPNTIAFHELAISLYFRTEDYDRCSQTARKLARLKSSLSPREQFMFAESLYRTKQFTEAEPAFKAVNKDNGFYQQSVYRLAQLARRQQNEKKALSLFAKLVETEKNSLWKEYAERELQFAKVKARM